MYYKHNQNITFKGRLNERRTEDIIATYLVDCIVLEDQRLQCVYQAQELHLLMYFLSYLCRCTVLKRKFQNTVEYLLIGFYFCTKEKSFLTRISVVWINGINWVSLWWNYDLPYGENISFPMVKLLVSLWEVCEIP